MGARTHSGNSSCPLKGTLLLILPIPGDVKEEIARFIGLVPLACVDFRPSVSRFVTASDASEFGDGVTVSNGLTPVGCMASHCTVRGDLVEPLDVSGVLTVGLFDGVPLEWQLTAWAGASKDM